MEFRQSSPQTSGENWFWIPLQKGIAFASPRTISLSHCQAKGHIILKVIRSRRLRNLHKWSARGGLVQGFAKLFTHFHLLRETLQFEFEVGARTMRGFLLQLTLAVLGCFIFLHLPTWLEGDSKLRIFGIQFSFAWALFFFFTTLLRKRNAFSKPALWVLDAKFSGKALELEKIKALIISKKPHEKNGQAGEPVLDVLFCALFLALMSTSVLELSGVFSDYPFPRDTLNLLLIVINFVLGYWVLAAVAPFLVAPMMGLFRFEWSSKHAEISETDLEACLAACRNLIRIEKDLPVPGGKSQIYEWSDGTWEEILEIAQSDDLGRGSLSALSL